MPLYLMIALTFTVSWLKAVKEDNDLFYGVKRPDLNIKINNRDFILNYSKDIQKDGILYKGLVQDKTILEGDVLSQSTGSPRTVFFEYSTGVGNDFKFGNYPQAVNSIQKQYYYNYLDHIRHAIANAIDSAE